MIALSSAFIVFKFGVERSDKFANADDNREEAEPNRIKIISNAARLVGVAIEFPRWESRTKRHFRIEEIMKEMIYSIWFIVVSTQLGLACFFMYSQFRFVHRFGFSFTPLSVCLLRFHDQHITTKILTHSHNSFQARHHMAVQLLWTLVQHQ